MRHRAPLPGSASEPGRRTTETPALPIAQRPRPSVRRVQQIEWRSETRQVLTGRVKRGTRSIESGCRTLCGHTYCPGTPLYPASGVTIRTNGAPVCIDATDSRSYSSRDATDSAMTVRTVLILLLIVFIAAAPAYAQRRADLPGTPAAVVLADSGQPLSLSGLFNSQTLRIGHSYEFSYSGFGGSNLGLGVYTTSLQWQPSSRLAARVDVGVAHSPFGSDDVRQALGFDQDTPARLFLRNAEIAYRPTENSVLRLQVQQNPAGSYGYGYAPYASPYGYGYGPTSATSIRARFGTETDALFWRNR